MRTLVAVLMLTLLAACGSDAPPSERGDVRTVERATVTDVPGGDGPILCTGPVRESAPPQCEGPVISNWDWDKVWGVAGEAGAQFGDYCFKGKDVGDTFELTTLPRPVGTCEAQEYSSASATVLENDLHGPQLCLGAVMTSLPVQCGGPDIPNWDWSRTKPTTEIGKSKDGVYVVHGVYVDGDFTLTRPPRPWKESDLPLDDPMPDFTTPCPEPEDGWFPKDRPKLDEYAVDRAAPFAEKIPGYSELWLDQQPQREPGVERPQQDHPERAGDQGREGRRGGDAHRLEGRAVRQRGQAHRQGASSDPGRSRRRSRTTDARFVVGK